MGVVEGCEVDGIHGGRDKTADTADDWHIIFFIKKFRKNRI
jgi:hypothetical protein